MRHDELVTKVREAGVVGAGGAGFPTHRKLASPVDTVIVNGAECEPLLNVDQVLLSQYQDDLVEGLEQVVLALGARRAFVAIKAKHESLMQRLQSAAGSRPWLKVVGLPDVYPIGDEQILTYHVLGRVIPPKGLPVHVDAVVVNVETLYNIGRALRGYPVTHTWVTIAGAVHRPITICAPVGATPIDLLSLAEPSIPEFAIMEGGPLMGRVVGMEQPITKTTKGLIVLPLSHPLARTLSPVDEMVKRVSRICCSCSLCTELCPRHLMGHPLAPHRIMRAVSQPAYNREVLAMAALCSECGLCDRYACFMGLSPRLVNQMLKALSRRTPTQAESNPLQLGPVKASRQFNQVPAERVLHRNGLSRWNREAPLFVGQLTPQVVRLPLKQHIGSPAQSLHQVGDTVHSGQLVGEIPSGALGARVHSSVSGVIEEISADEIVVRSVAEQ